MHNYQKFGIGYAYLLLFGKYGMGRATSKSRKVPLTKSL